MSGRRLSKQIVFGNLEGAVRRERSEKWREWIDSIQSDARAFGIAGGMKGMTLQARVWV